MNIRMVLAGMLVMTSAAVAQNQKLSPTYAAGMRWEASWESTSRIHTMDTPVGKSRVSGYMQEKASAEATVPQAADGKFKTLEVKYKACQIASQQPGAQRPTSPQHPLDRRKVTIERRADGVANEEKFDITGQGTAIAPDIEDSIKACWCVNLAPDKAIRPGESWKSDAIGKFFGGKAKGEMTLKYVKIEANAKGHRQAIVNVSGESSIDIAGAGGQLGTADLSVSCTFEGKIKIDPANGLIESIDLAGPMRLDHGGGGMTQYADWSYRYQATMLEAAPAAAQENQNNEANPLDDHADFTGTFKDDRLAVEFKAAAGAYAGTVTFKGKAYPAKASAKGNTLEGKYEAGTSSFPFTATVSTDGKTMKFVSGRAEYTLKKQDAPNPLEQPKEPNPLERP